MRVVDERVSETEFAGEDCFARGADARVGRHLPVGVFLSWAEGEESAEESPDDSRWVFAGKGSPGHRQQHMVPVGSKG